MRRAFTDEPIDADALDALLDLARRVPSAGNAQGLSWLVLDTPAATSRYWDLTLGDRRADFAFPGLVRAPVLVVALADPGAYVARYAEPDKASSGLGDGAEAWTVPYWFVDAGMAVQTLLLAVEDAGLGACFFGLFAHERAVLDAFGVPAHVRAAGTVAVGHPAAVPERPGRSSTRPRRADVIRRGSW
jgi:nitroreductase